ncbi:inactive leucine-rich repeat receptor-like serine/threonine-protein kinase At1g60630 [Andrographis paniculata]|uniref:inactive leucine-rich repeat receptor-like serine/threonine-protein kinase At1g60630 n=1 Tax=Andrographis paniculata TaxID=175694 RepID=UPI0021E9ABD7|nr:inactive leucine-rich repeat receptor-like serine/threonine-protein kinase At1g60630 [Andrographis paniculata]
MVCTFPSSSRYNFLFLFLFFFLLSTTSRSDDAGALLSLKSAVDTVGVLRWSRSANVCQWEGVRECLHGRVSKLVVESFNLTGKLDGTSLNQLDQIRVLSLKDNSLSGEIPELSGLKNLKSIYLNNNRFSGPIPVSLSAMHRLKIIVLSGNDLSGQIPASFAALTRLYVLFLQDNRLSGPIPAFNQTGLRFFNVSNNALSGPIPQTAALARFNATSFSRNLNLCGELAGRRCGGGIAPSASPSYPIMPKNSSRHRRRIILISVLCAAGLVALCVLVIVWMVCMRKKSNGKENGSKVVAGGAEDGGTPGGGSGGGAASARRGDHSGDKHGGFSWDQGAEGLGSLTFLGPGDQQMNYSLEDLLKASAETLGRGTIGSTYKAVMESGYIVTVKRLKDARYPSMEEFRRHIEILGRLRHPNLVPLRAYFQAKEERLLVYDYFPNGSLFSLIHGSRAAGGSKPLHWTSCLKIAEDVATGLLYIHQNPGLTHGNLKSTNILLGSDFESCLTDYGLTAFRNPESNEESSASSLFYRAPECRDPRRPLSQPADVYSYGVLLLELLTGKTPFQDLVQEHGANIPAWVRSVREEETESGDEVSASEEKLAALLNIAMACVAVGADSRPAMKEVVRMIREARAEAHLSSNSSDHSPGRWSDTVQSLPREEHLSI